MELLTVKQLLAGNRYPGRGIIAGVSADGASAVIAYFIMGRSQNSRNRVFTPTADGIVTEAADPAKMKDPSLIIYAPVRTLDAATIVTNGDQTDTIYDALAGGKTFAGALRTREFEPDAPNYTPRISAAVTREGGAFIEMSILKSRDGDPEGCERFFWEYQNPAAGEGRVIHTYEGDGDPLPSFEGEPRRVRISGDCDAFVDEVWAALDEDNRISLFVRYIDLKSGETQDRIINKYSVKA